MNNGQYYGGWRPPALPQYPPYPPQAQPPRLPGGPPGAPYAPPGGPGAAAAPPPAPAQELTQTATIRNAVNLKKNTLQVLWAWSHRWRLWRPCLACVCCLPR